MSFKDVFEQIANSPSEEATFAAFSAILRGEWSTAQIAAFAGLLRATPTSRAVLLGGARALRATMRAVDHGLALTLDTCGTGGDGSHSLNISTCVAIVVASLGIPVAKHGNRSVSSRSGSADVIEALGLPLDLPPARSAELLRSSNIAFLMAPFHHPALAHAAEARRSLGVRTVFNALGPLANPARVSTQLVGVFSDELRVPMAATLAALDTRRAWVVRGEDGVDEISATTTTRVCVLNADGELTDRTVCPEDFGAPTSPAAAIAGGSAEQNAASIEAILRGEPHPAQVAVAINVAAALHVARGTPLREAYSEAMATLISGSAYGTLENWRKHAKEVIQ